MSILDKTQLNALRIHKASGLERDVLDTIADRDAKIERLRGTLVELQNHYANLSPYLVGIVDRALEETK